MKFIRGEPSERSPLSNPSFCACSALMVALQSRAGLRDWPFGSFDLATGQDGTIARLLYDQVLSGQVVV
jgi:hypothetical protein